MRVVIAGASGLIGGALGPALVAAGHEVRCLVRRAPTSADEIFWNPAVRELDAGQLEGADAIVNLAGENVGTGRWTAGRREKIFRSRVDTTLTLVTGFAKLARKPAVFVSASAVGFYGSRGDEQLTEANGIGQGFLPEVCLAWETHAEGAARMGIRTVTTRFGVVLSRDGGALAKMLPIFRIGVGGRLGDGRQWMSWVSLADAIGAIGHVLTDRRCSGPVNVVAPAAVTNVEFTATLARVLRRPALAAVPAWGLRAVFGQMAEETVLASTRAQPVRLGETGFVFQHETLEAALRQTLGRES
ncbi:MAG: TIGR01777 family protein [Opitutus sp.]|nr:TIGR01777 family protein [Opitutus sp.]